MVRKSLLVAVLLAIATPIAAQQEYVWTSKRPDGHAPIGVMNGRTLERGAVEFSYRYSQLSSRGVWLANDSLPLETTLEFYDVAPLTLTNQTHNFSVSVGATENLSFVANMVYSTREREQLTSGGVFYVNQIEELGDLSVTGLYSFINSGPYRAHVQLGALVPTGKEDVFGETPFSTPDAEALPYDMRPGAGTFALLPGMTVSVQNEVGGFGAQVSANMPLGENDRQFALGRSTMGTVWASYMMNRYFSFSGRVRWQNWAGITGGDPDLDPARDPGNDGFFLEGERVDLPIGVNFYLPEGSRFAGHRLSFEAIFPVSHEYTGPQLGLDWGMVIGWQVVF
jgi:hypothetical protein